MLIVFVSSEGPIGSLKCKNYSSTVPGVNVGLLLCGLARHVHQFGLIFTRRAEGKVRYLNEDFKGSKALANIY